VVVVVVVVRDKRDLGIKNPRQPLICFPEGGKVWVKITTIQVKISKNRGQQGDVGGGHGLSLVSFPTAKFAKYTKKTRHDGVSLKIQINSYLNNRWAKSLATGTITIV
jgi:hypothetical protein